MKNKATLKFKNFTARPRFFWVRTKLARTGAALCCARPAEAACLERSSTVAKPSGVGKNLKSRNFKSLNFKNRNATSTNCQAGDYIDFSTDYDAGYDIRPSADLDIISNADYDINSNRDRAVNFKISNANLKANLAVLKADLKTDFRL